VCDLVRCRHSPCWRRAVPSSRYVKSKMLINPCVLIRLHGHQLALQPCNDSSPIIFIESEGGGQGMDKKCRRLDAPSRSVVRACRGPESYRRCLLGKSDSIIRCACAHPSRRRWRVASLRFASAGWLWCPFACCCRAVSLSRAQDQSIYI
jgi:hypothetical protein